MDVRAELARAIERARLELRARMGMGRKQKKLKKLGRPAKTGPGAGCGTGKGGFQSGNNCALEDGIPQKPFSKGGALKKANPKQLKAEVQAQKQKTAAKVAAKEAAQKKKGLSDRKKNAASRKKAKEAKAADEAKKASDAAAAKKKEMLQKLRIKKANEKLPVAATPKSVKEQLDEAKTAMKAKTAEASKKLAVAGTPKSLADEINAAKATEASKKLAVVGTPKSVKEQIEEIKAAEAKQKAIEAAQKQAAEEAVAKQKAIAEARAKTAEKGKPAPVKKTDDTGEKMLKEIESPPTTPPPQSLKTEKALGGSTGAVLATDAAGAKFVVKGGKSKEHIESESQADDLYRAAGADVPKQQLHVDADGSSKKVAEFVAGKTLADLKATNTKQYEAAVAKLKKHFVADALFANHDVVGMNLDNIVVGKGGKVFRVDNGGSLTFRAQGKTKTFGPDVNEIDTLRSSSVNQASASVYGSLTNREISAQITQLMKRKEAILAAAKTEKLRDVLRQRFDSLQAWQKKQKAANKSASASLKSFKPGRGTTQHAEYFTPQLAARIKEMASKQQFQGESGARVLKALKKGVTDDKMTEGERIRVVDAVWHSSLSQAERAAVTKWGSNAWQTLRDKMKAGQYGDPEVKDLISGLKKLPSYRGLSSRDLSGISASQAEGWLKSKVWDTSFPTAPQNGTAASFSNYDRVKKFYKKEHTGGASKGSVTVVAIKSKSIMDTGDKMPYFSAGLEKEALAQHTGKYKIRRHYYLVASQHPLVKAGKLESGKEYSDREILNASGKKKKPPGYSLMDSENVRLVIEVEEI